MARAEAHLEALAIEALLWGTNYERFWPQFLVWKKHESLLAWIVTQHARKRRGMVTYLSDPRWSHIRFVRLTSTREVEAFAAAVERAVGAEPLGAVRRRAEPDSAGTAG